VTVYGFTTGGFTSQDQGIVTDDEPCYATNEAPFRADVFNRVHPCSPEPTAINGCDPVISRDSKINPSSVVILARSSSGKTRLISSGIDYR